MEISKAWILLSAAAKLPEADDSYFLFSLNADSFLLFKNQGLEEGFLIYLFVGLFYFSYLTGVYSRDKHVCLGVGEVKMSKR